MRLLFLHRDLPPDSYTGVAVQVHRLAEALCARGHEVDVYSESEAPAGARYRALPIRSKGLRIALRVAPFLKRLWYPLFLRGLDFSGYDAVHIHGDGGFLRYRDHWVRTFYGTAALEARHAPTLKGRLAQGLSYLLERREARRCRHAVGISPHVARWLPGVDRIIPCMLPDAPDREQAAKTTYPSILFLGSLASRKRGGLALELFQRLRERFPELRMSWVGPEREAAVLRVRPEYAGVEFLSRVAQSDLHALFRRSWIHLCLSAYEGFGVGLIEAMAYSCVAVTTPHPGSDWLIRDGENGVVAAPDSMHSALERILGDAPLRGAIAARARAAAAEYAPDQVAARYEEVYRVAAATQDALGKQGAQGPGRTAKPDRAREDGYSSPPSSLVPGPWPLAPDGSVANGAEP